MSMDVDEAFLQAFSEVIRGQISAKREVKIEGIGLFKAGHENQYQQKYQDGRVVMMPPKDTIEFIPDRKWTNG
jgi:nucleoid DNA-binding protein